MLVRGGGVGGAAAGALMLLRMAARRAITALSAASAEGPVEPSAKPLRDGAVTAANRQISATRLAI